MADMPKLKIKTEHLPKRCEICHQKDCFDAYLNHCSRCSPNNQAIDQHSYRAFSTIAETVPDICPRGIAINISNEVSIITYNWFTRYSLLICLISAIYIFLMLFGGKGGIVENIVALQQNLSVFSIVIMLTLFIIYFAIASCINRTTIRITLSEITISQGPLPWIHNHRFSINEISRTYVDENIDKNGYAWYRVRVFLNNGSSYIITPYMFNSETAFFIADQLFKWVRVIRVTL